MKKIILVLFSTFCVSVLFAQDSTSGGNSRAERRTEKRDQINAMVKQDEEGVLSYYKQNSFGVQLRTNGYGAFYELGRMKSPRFINTYVLEIDEIKHSKEVKSGSTERFFSNTYVFGKINNFYPVKLGFGQQYIFGQKGNKNGIAVLGIYQAGLSLGLLKPYYLEVRDGQGGTKFVSYNKNDGTNSVFLDRSAILGSGGLKGFNEISLQPGAYVKTALRFDFGKYNESISALEIGISVEGYAKKIELMLLNDPQRLFFQGHLAFVFGRRK